ncbi:interleukin-20 receptor subunit alpha-like [Heterodontus francisci]|uniref:interleukin-20 receptor subunit alpha-like n=1 Tax=Heterodontus francisci TaxID=7792 RepID=UPI00355BE6D4
MSEDLSAVWANGNMTKSAVWIIIFLHLLLHVLGQLPAPQNVDLTSVNFRYFVTWKPGARSPSGIRYTVEACNLSRNNGIFTPVKNCSNISTLSCDLSHIFKNPFALYWVRVKSITSTSESKWVESKELQPLRDTILGPPIINVRSNNQIIEVTLDMPLTPHKRKDNDKLKKVNDIDRLLTYIVILLDKDSKQYANVKVETDKLGKGYYRFENLKPKFTYCVVAKLESAQNRHTKDSTKICRTTSTQNADMLWIAPLIAVIIVIAGTIIVGIMIWMLKEFTCLHLARSQLPKSLIIISEDLHVNLQCQELDKNPEGDHISFILHDASSNDYQLKCQSTDLTTKLQLNSRISVTDTDESIFYQSNGLSTEGYEHNNLMKETDVCAYKDFGSFPPCVQSSIENRGGTSSTQQGSLGAPILYNLQCQQFSSLKDTEETSSSNDAENVPILKTLHPDLDTFQEIQTETIKIELWKCADVPLSSVKLCLNNDTEEENSEVGTCGNDTSNMLSTDDLCSQFTCDLTAATDLPLKGIQEYEAQSIKLPQFINDFKFQNLSQKPSFHISEHECMQFSEYEAH